MKDPAPVTPEDAAAAPPGTGEPGGAGAATPTISVCLPVRNAERTLERFLASFRPFADELCFLDTGSTDRTLEILDAHRAQAGAPIVVDRARWGDDYGAARNAADEMATGDYILWSDDDELLAAGADISDRPSAAATRDLLAALEPPVALARRITAWSRDVASSTYCVRLYRRELRGSWFGRIHERLDLPAEARRTGGVFAPSVLTVIHHPIAGKGRHDHRPLVEREHAAAPSRQSALQLARHLIHDDRDVEAAAKLLEGVVAQPWPADDVPWVIDGADLLFKVAAACGDLRGAAAARELLARAHEEASEDAVWRYTDALNRADPIGPGHSIWAVVDRLEHDDARRTA